VSLRLLKVAACAAAVLCIAAPASAHHSASATASLAMDPASPSCKLVEKTYRTKCKGSRVVRVTWSVSCAYPDPGVDVRFWTPRPGRSPFEMEAVEADGTSGVTVKRFPAGTKVFATVKVFCDFPGDDTIDAHRVEAESPPTAEAFIPPRLLRVKSVTNSFCGVNVNRTLERYGLQARQTSAWDFSLVFNDDSLLGVSRYSTAGRAKTVLRAKGAGINDRGPAAPWIPGPTGRIPTAAGTRLVPRKAGPLKVWAVIGGAKTNVLTLRVLPKRCRY
jgi:hypothetical protein